LNEGEIYDGLWSGPGFKKMIQDYNALIEKFPHRVQKGHKGNSISRLTRRSSNKSAMQMEGEHNESL
jgi:hypothetical protein